ncbi:MAG: hypothetical protein ACYC1M_12225 [Armatimonadota bacterium]
MANFNLHRFSNPGALKSISSEHLIAFLSPYKDFLRSRGLEIPSDTSVVDSFPYAALLQILMTPDAGMPKELIEALYFVHEMATTEGMDTLLTAAQLAGITLDNSPDATPIDVAIRVWLCAREILESKHAEQLLVKVRTFEYYQAVKVYGTRFTPTPTTPTPNAEIITALQNDMDSWFVVKKRGSGTRVFCFPREDATWFIVRHGEPYKREGSLEAGESSSVFYRPEKHDVIVYQSEAAELRINAGTKGEKELYRKLFGSHLFGSEDHFPGKGKYSLDPLKYDGEASTVCSDVAGIEWVKLKEVQFLWGGAYEYVEVWKAADIFAVLRSRGKSIPQAARIIKASFYVKFEDSKTPRTVSVRPSNIAQFQRDGDGELVEAWLRARGFVLVPGSDENGADDETE